MSTDNEIFSRFRRVMLQAFSHTEIILGNQNMSIPETNFCTLLLTEVSSSWGETSYHDNDSGNLDEMIQTRVRYMVSVNFFRTDRFKASPMQQARRLGAFMRSGIGTRSMSDEALGFISATPARNLSALEGAEFEGRAQTDIIISAMESDSFQLEAIDTMPLSATFGDGEVSYSMNLNINTDNTN